MQGNEKKTKPFNFMGFWSIFRWQMKIGKKTRTPSKIWCKLFVNSGTERNRHSFRKWLRVFCMSAAISVCLPYDVWRCIGCVWAKHHVKSQFAHEHEQPEREKTKATTKKTMFPELWRNNNNLHWARASIYVKGNLYERNKKKHTYKREEK